MKFFSLSSNADVMFKETSYLMSNEKHLETGSTISIYTSLFAELGIFDDSQSIRLSTKKRAYELPQIYIFHKKSLYSKAVYFSVKSK